jgi:chromate transporter
MPDFVQQETIQHPPLKTALKYWFKLGWISFGGPAGQIALLHDELVVRRHWISEKRFLHALNYCMILPGPEAQQLATYTGWLLHGRLGGILAGALFILPSLFILMALAWIYMVWGHTIVLAGIFAGIKPAVTVIVLQAAWRLGSFSHCAGGTDRLVIGSRRIFISVCRQSWRNAAH